MEDDDTKKAGTSNASSQIEEIEVMCSIYGDSWQTEDEGTRSYSIEIKEGSVSIVFYVTLPDLYPFESPPVYSLLAPELSRNEKQILSAQLEEVYLENIGQSVLYQWVEKIREFLASVEEKKKEKETDSDMLLEEHLAEIASDSFLTYDNNSEEESFLGEIHHGEIIVDRKSTFQGHAASVIHVEQVKLVLKKLYENKKIASATHNMYAYRISLDKTNHIQDCEDDGENQAGGRLLHLLQILNVTNVLVIVTRWYGGIHLGGDRFRHINNSARQVLEQAGLIMCSSKKKK